MRTYEQRQSRSGNRSTEIQRTYKAAGRYEYTISMTKRTRRSESVNEKKAPSLTAARKIARDWRVA